MKKQNHFLGAHFSVAGGPEHALYTAKSLDCTVAQIFTKNSRTWKEFMPDQDRINTFIDARKKIGITHVLSHASYLINIASSHKEKLKKSIQALTSELIRSSKLGIDYVVLHPGAFLDTSEHVGISRAADSLKEAFEKAGKSAPRLLIETTAGQGTCLGHTFEHIKKILDLTNIHEKTGVCMDTCHMFAAGMDISRPDKYEKTLTGFDALIGLDRLFAIHLNDSKTPLGSNKDRHAHIGEGHIGETGFHLIMNDKRLQHIPKILETPKDRDGQEMDPVNLARLLSLID